MKKLRVGIIDLISKSPNSSLYARAMYANLMGIMPQVVAVWAEELGHEVTLVAYTGRENLVAELPQDVDVVFISAFTQSAQLAYALSNRFRHEGAITILGGPHARAYPMDGCKYFDYVLGFTHKSTIKNILDGPEQHRPLGVHIAEKIQPIHLPGVEERWKYIEATLKKAPFLKIVPLVASMGCPYTCSFCVDANVPYQQMEFEGLRKDLQFLLTKFKRPLVVWHDPNFGVKFDEILSMIEDAIPTNSMDFIAENSLSLLKEDNLKRLQKNGFNALLPGIESWFDLGGKSKTGQRQGMDKMRDVSDHVNMIMRYIPYVQTNFVFGMDSDFGAEPFEVTKAFVDRTPGAFPGYSLLTAFGQAAPLNESYYNDNRVLPFPHHFLNNHHAMNVKPRNYEWPEFYDHVIDVSKHTWSWKAIGRRWSANNRYQVKLMNFMRAVSQEGFGRIKYHSTIRRLLDEDKQFRAFFEGESGILPKFYMDMLKRDLGEMWEWLPEGAIYHDGDVYQKKIVAKAGKLAV
ncbi:MAG: radical SAM protein [Bacteroidia bacterium]|nr:radical SAM protein [Bacteroidia bacterium]